MIRRRHFLLAGTAAVLAASGLAFQAARKPAVMTSADPLIVGFEKTTSASVADAVDQIVGKRGFMSHDMRPRIPGKFVGRAATALMRQTTPDKATAQLSARHSVAMIDNAKPGEVGVIVIENGLDVAGLGGLMGTAAKARGMAGIIIDGGVRDVAEVRSLGLSVYSRSVVPSSSAVACCSAAASASEICSRRRPPRRLSSYAFRRIGSRSTVYASLMRLEMRAMALRCSVSRCRLASGWNARELAWNALRTSLAGASERTWRIW